MAQKSTPVKPKSKRTARGVVDRDPATNADSRTAQAPPPAEANGELSKNGRSSLAPILIWFLGLSALLTGVGLVIQGIPQLSETIRWLIYRQGYPYFQAIALSALVVTASVVIPGAVQRVTTIDQVHWIVRPILELLLVISSRYRSNRVWEALLGGSIVLFFISLYLPMCLSSRSILVSFDILESGNPVRQTFPGETLSYAPARYLEIEAKAEANLFNLPPPHIRCEWVTSTGDGRIIQRTNCKINYQTGNDDRSDPVVVRMVQNGCTRSFGYFSFFLSRTQ